MHEVAMTPFGYTCEQEVNQSERPANVHLMEDVYIAEVVHPETYEPVEEGKEGVLVVSNLFSESQPILRFLMGDLTALTKEPSWRTHMRAMEDCGAGLTVS
jgi:phenylacetate-CoA ligase